MPEFSVVVPLYKCEPFIHELVERLTKTLTTLDERFEVILVNDASPAGDWKEVVRETGKDRRIKGINLSRNFGQHYAITAGLSHATGNWIVVMDGDLQDRPEEIIRLFEETKKGNEIVFAQRANRTDGLFKKLFSKLFYAVFGYLTDTNLDYSVANFGMYHEKAIKAFLAMKDETRFFPTMIQLVGFNKSYLPVKHEARPQGKSSYSFRSLIGLAKNNIIAFSDKPLHLTVRFGFFMALISFGVGIYYLILYFTGKIVQLGFTSLILSIWFLSGVIIMILGIIGLYLGKIFDKVKDRPSFIVKEKINLDQS